MRVGGLGGGDDFGFCCVGAAEAKVFVHRSVEQIRVLGDDGDHASDRVRVEGAKVLAADPDGAGLRVVQPQQQADDRRFAGTAWADDADAFSGIYGERQVGVGGAAAAWIREADIFERDTGGQVFGAGGAGGGTDRHFQQGVDAGGGGLAVKAGMQDAAQVAQRAENFGAGHEDDQQRLQAHVPVVHAVGAVGQSRGRSQGGAEVRQAPCGDAQGEDPEGGVRQRPRFIRQHAAVGAALPESFQRRQALDGVQEFLAEAFEGALAGAGCHGGFAVDGDGQDQGEQRGSEHDGGDGDIPPRDEDEDRDGGAQRDRQLRNVLAEEGLQLLDPVDHGQHDAAGPFGAEPRRAEGEDFVVELAAQIDLDDGRGAVRDHRARVVEPCPRQDRGGGCCYRWDQVAGGGLLKHQRDEAPQEGEAGDTGR